MRKNYFFGLLIAMLAIILPTKSVFAQETVVEPEVTYTLTTERLSASDLMAATEPVYIAIKNLSATNNYYFVGNTGGVPYSKPEFSDDAVFVWEPMVAGVAGAAYVLKKLDGTVMTSTSPTTFSADSGAGAVFVATNPTVANGGFNGDADSQNYIDDQNLLVRFVVGGTTGTTWINVQNGDGGTPAYNSGTGGWTVHNVYKVAKEQVEVVPPAEPDAEVVAEVEALLAFDGIGYPKNAERVALQEALDAYTSNVNDETLAALNAEIESYYSTANVNLPSAGKWYTITSVAPNGKEFYIDFDGTKTILVERTEDTVIPSSAQFKFENFGYGKYRIMANDSIYLVYRNAVDKDWMINDSYTGIQNKNDVDAVDELGQITFSRIDASAANVSATSKDLFGLMQWNSPRGIRPENNENVPGCLVIKHTEGVFDSADAPFYNDNHTSALRIEPAVFPPLGASEPVVIDLINDTWTPALPSTWNSATYTTQEYSNGTYTIKITDNSSCYIENGQAYRLSGGASKITLPAFDFDVAKIEVVGHETAAANYATSSMNVFVGTKEVSTACYGSTGVNTFAIAADNQAAGTEYVLKVGNDGSKTIFITAIKVYPASSLEAPVFSVEGGVYSSAKSITISTPSASVKGVTKVDYYYTTDGTEPDDKSLKAYNGSLTVSKSCTVKAIAYLTYNDEKVPTPVSSQEYIISENIPYEKASEVVAGNYLIAAGTNIAVPYVGAASTYAIKTTSVTVNGNYVETAAYYGFSFEATAGGYYIKDANGKYLAASKQLTGGGTSAQNIKLIDQPGITDYCVWSVALADGVATITCYVDYMGATATGVLLYNSGSKAFELYDQASAPMTLEKPVLYLGGKYPTLSWSPAATDEVTELKEFTFVCEQGLAFNAEAGQVVLNSYELVNGAEKTNSVVLTPTVKDANTIVLAASEAIKTYGDYQLLIPAGYFVLDPNGLAMPCKETGEMYSLKAPAAKLEIDEITPENNSVVESLSQVQVKFKVGVFINELPITVYNADGDSVTTVKPGQDSEYGWDVAVYTFAEEITADGTYTFTIPAGYVWDENNEATKLSETKLTFTIGDEPVTPPVGPTPGTFEILSVTPDDGSSVDYISTISVEFNDNIKASTLLLPSDPYPIYLGNALIPVAMGSWTIDGNILTINFSDKITTPGTYTLKIASGIFFGESSDNTVSKNITIVVGTSVDTSIDGVDAEVEQVIYDITGRRIEKITNAGVYIVNGVKVLVK